MSAVGRLEGYRVSKECQEARLLNKGGNSNLFWLCIHTGESPHSAGLPTSCKILTVLVLGSGATGRSLRDLQNFALWRIV